MAMQMQLLKGHFANVIRLIQRSRLDRAEQIRYASYEALKLLNVKRDRSKAVKKLAVGSDQGDVGSILAWIKNLRVPPDGADNAVKKDFRQAVKQLVAIDATAVIRTGK